MLPRSPPRNDVISLPFIFAGQAARPQTPFAHILAKTANAIGIRTESCNRVRNQRCRRSDGEITRPFYLIFRAISFKPSLHFRCQIGRRHRWPPAPGTHSGRRFASFHNCLQPFPFRRQPTSVKLNISCRPIGCHPHHRIRREGVVFQRKPAVSEDNRLKPFVHTAKK